jgi:stage II sporulation protein AA (anti-sigma F factor antagonist)
VLEIDMEFRKGILFIRLTGKLDKNTISKLNSEVTELVKDNGIKNIVFNIDGLTSIDLKGINSLLYNYELSKMNDGKTLLCGINNSLVRYRIINSRLLNYMYEVSDELSAIKVIGM